MNYSVSKNRDETQDSVSISRDGNLIPSLTIETELKISSLFLKTKTQFRL